MNNGWIKIHRKFLDWEWWDDHNTSRLFFYLLLKANHKPKKWRGIIIERGQLLTSLESLCKATGISVQSIRTSIDRLKSTSEITNQSTNQYRIITVCNYDSYQIKEDTADKQNNSPLTINQQTTNKQLTTNKNIKNDKNIYIVEEWDKKFVQFAKEMMSDITWQEVIRRQRDKLRKKDNMRAAIEHFISHCHLNKHTHEKIDDFKNHFQNFILTDAYFKIEFN